MSRQQLKAKPVAESNQSTSLSEQVWGLDWSKEFPLTIAGDIRVEYMRADKANPLLKALLPAVYQIDPAAAKFGEADKQGFKAKYFEAVGDFFAFFDGDNNVGMAIGTMLDWSSFNFRNIAVAPAYQNRGLYPLFFEELARILKQYGVSRIEGDVSPTNRHHVHALNKMGSIVTSLAYGERWGVLLHFTTYLNEADEERVGDLFCTTHKTDSASNKKQKGVEK